LISGSYRGLRGGSFLGLDRIRRADSRNDDDPTNELNNIGFRVASIVPEPGSLGLLVLGAAGMVARRRRLAR